MAYSDAKSHQGKSYRGMRVGGLHRWVYPDGHWTERKVAPDRWAITFSSRKRRRAKAPRGSGAEAGSQYHWFIVAHQWADKLDANTYATHLEGSKFLLSFKKPGWRGWSTQQRGHKGAREKAIAALEAMIERLRHAPDAEFEDPADLGTMQDIAALGPVEEWREGPVEGREERAVAAASGGRTRSTAAKSPTTAKAASRRTAAKRTTARPTRTGPRSKHKPPADLDGTPTTVPNGPATSF